VKYLKWRSTSGRRFLLQRPVECISKRNSRVNLNQAIFGNNASTVGQQNASEVEA